MCKCVGNPILRPDRRALSLDSARVLWSALERVVWLLLEVSRSEDPSREEERLGRTKWEK